MQLNLLLFILGFVLIWIGSGIAIKSVERIAHSLRVSTFSVSFLILGLFTSMSELSVGINSIIKNDPEIFVGNLIGASIVLFMLVTPLLAIVGNSVRISAEFTGFNLMLSLLVVGLPVVLAMDGKVDAVDGFLAVVAYALLVLKMQSKRSLLEKISGMTMNRSKKIGFEIVRVLVGVMIIFGASKLIVDQTLYFSNLLKISPFIISLLFISVGTNVPELSLVFRSMFTKGNQVALGDYVGSAAFNTFLIGALTLSYGRTVYLTNSYLVSLVFLIFGLMMFYVFAKSKSILSRKEGLILLSIYLIFIWTEISIH